MKKLLLLLTFCSITEAQTTATAAGNITLYKAGVVQTPKYSQQYTALVAAILQSQSCKCEIVVKTSDIIVNTKATASSSSSSIASISSSSTSSSSSISGTALAWTAPTIREGGAALSSNEIAGYKVRYLSGNTFKIVDVNSLSYTVPESITKFDLAVVDSGGVWSDWVSLSL